MKLLACAGIPWPLFINLRRSCVFGAAETRYFTKITLMYVVDGRSAEPVRDATLCSGKFNASNVDKIRTRNECEPNACETHN